jgi:hypothetical protein
LRSPNLRRPQEKTGTMATSVEALRVTVGPKVNYVTIKMTYVDNKNNLCHTCNGPKVEAVVATTSLKAT